MQKSSSAKLLQNSKWRGGGISSFEEIPYSSVWKSIPTTSTIDIKDEMKFENLNADSYYDRLVIYKRIMDATPFSITQFHHTDQIIDNKYVNFGSHSFHFLWGYISQLYWQKQSGRLQMASTNSSLCSSDVFGISAAAITNFDSIDNIDPNAWWGRMNFSLCVTILIAAERAGLLKKQSIVSGAYIKTLEDHYQPGIDSWRQAFEYYKSCNHGNMTVSQYDTFRRYSWNAHTHCLDIAMQINDPYYQQLPRDEQYLGLGWCRFVEFFAGARWRTDLIAIASLGAGYLPPSILYTNDPIVLPVDEISSSASAGDERILKRIVDSNSSSSNNKSIDNSNYSSPSMSFSQSNEVQQLQLQQLYEQETIRLNLSLQSVKNLGTASPQIVKFQIMFLTQCCKREVAREHFPNLLCVLLFRKGTFWWLQIPVLFWWWMLSFTSVTE